MRASRFLVSVPVVCAMLAAMPLARAQDDRRAGLFCRARQLPLISQSLTLRIVGGDAELRLVQCFLNDGEDVGQADYRLPLPLDATVTGFGFWNDGEYLAAELQERERAERRHAAAAGEGRATALMTREETIQSFSVFPLRAGERKRVQVTIRFPVARELRRYHVRVPLDAFAAGTSPRSIVLVDLQGEEPIDDYGVSAQATRTLAREARRLRLALTAHESFELWWMEEGPPLAFRARAVSVAEDGSLGFELLALWNDASAWRSPDETLHVLVDASRSMRRRSLALREVLERVRARATIPVRWHTLAEEARERSGPEDVVEAIAEPGRAYRANGSRFMEELEALGCSDSGVRCAVITDPQLDGLAEIAEKGVPLLLLADVHEQAHFAGELPPSSTLLLPGVDPSGRLLAAADELVGPVLAIETLLQDGVTVGLPGEQRHRMADGGMLRLYGRLGRSSPLELRGTIDGAPFEREVPLESVADTSPAGVAIRRGVFREVLAEWLRTYRRRPDDELRQRIVRLSLREGIPTALTAFQVDDPRLAELPRTATPAGACLLCGLAALAAAALLAAAPGRRRGARS